jgi:prepilin-type N-terminal cleavage/methylation domain-containing protein/prepilin-type processing-associated H-X9-DG protein
MSYRKPQISHVACKDARPNGFSLVELLVVIGVIAILIGLLLPTLARAREQSKMVACKAQLQNIGSAFQMYVNDNQGRYPPAPTLPGVPPEDIQSLVDFLGRYVGTQTNVFHCPADDILFPQIGISYFYYVELGLYPLRDTTFFKYARTSGKVPILWDAGTFHGGTVPHNWLFADGHVDEFLAGSTPGLQGEQ